MTIRNYRFDIDTPAKALVSIIIAAPNAQAAREDAYMLLGADWGKIARIKTNAVDAKVMRRMPNNLEQIKRAHTVNDAGQKVYWAWYVYTG